MPRNDYEKWQMDLEEYIKQGEPEQSEKSTAWKTDIGLQDVDGLKTSEYLLETAKEHKVNAAYDTIVTPLSIDVSMGDAIMPGAVLYEFSGIFDEEVFHVTYMLGITQRFDKQLFEEAMPATAEHRGSTEQKQIVSELSRGLRKITSSGISGRSTGRGFPMLARLGMRIS